MLSTTMIMNAVGDELLKADPDAYIYVTFQPSDFKRPCHYIELAKETVTDASRTLVSVSSYFTITSFIPKDNDGESHAQDLLEIQNTVLSIFRKGYIKVADRAIKIKASTGGYSIDRVYVDFQADYFDDREETTEPPDVMENVEIQIRKG